MSRVRTEFRCTACGGAAPSWRGRCPSCGEWNTLVEEVEAHEPRNLTAAPLAPEQRARPVTEVDAGGGAAVATGVPELDRVLGGGLVPGSVTLVGGEPGIGKSTLLLQAVAAVAARGTRALLVSAEESVQQVRLRAERLGALHPDVWLASVTSLPHLLAQVEEVEPAVVVVDSIQTVHDPELGTAPGSVTQVRECAHQLVRVAKERGMATVFVGHVTKEGSLAGPRVLEHVVDTVLSFEGDRHHALRLLRAVKHRFGSTQELGVFEMTDGGMAGVADPSKLFLGDRCAGEAGSVVVPTMEGHRPLLVELQALVAQTPLAMPRRAVQGLDPSRLALLLAVLDRRAGQSFGSLDVYASAVGGVRVVEPGADLALALALVSARTGAPVPPDLVAVGEVGLGGELRQTAQAARRLAEAARLGFTRAIVPASVDVETRGMTITPAATVGDAIRFALPAAHAAEGGPSGWQHERENSVPGRSGSAGRPGTPL